MQIEDIAMRLPDYEAWAIFATVAERQSFTAAADTLSLSKATISKAVARLEASLGTVLFHRTSRTLSLSAAGRQLLPHARQLVAGGEAAMEAARSERRALSGRVRIAAPMSFGISHLGPILADFMAQHPDIIVDLNLSDARVDLVDEGYDLALRIAALEDSSLRVVHLCGIKRHLVAAPAYLAQRGLPDHPRDLAEDLGRHRCFIYANLPQYENWHFANTDGDRVGIRPIAAMQTNNADVIMPALLAGHGMAQLPDFLVDTHVAAGRLVIVLPEWAQLDLSLNLLMPPSRYRPARVEALIDFLKSRF